jgi:hypothetical protein
MGIESNTLINLSIVTGVGDLSFSPPFLPIKITKKLPYPSRRLA